MPPARASQPNTIEVLFLTAEACEVHIADDFNPRNSANPPLRGEARWEGESARQRGQPRVAHAAAPWMAREKAMRNSEEQLKALPSRRLEC